MDLKAASDGDMSKKKTSKGAFHGPASGFFAQKKKIVLENIKHSGNEKNISLSKSVSGNSMYSNVDSLSGDDKDVGMTGVNNGSLLGSAATIPKTKHINIGTVFGFPLGSLDFTIDNDEIMLPLHLSISLKKKWIDLKIIKVPVEVQWFWRGTTPSKFEGIIRSTFTSEESINRAILLAKEKEININSNLKRQKICSNRAVVIKKILIDTPKEMIVTALAEFGTLLDGTGERTCIINCSMDFGNQVHCIMVGFKSEENLESAYHTELIFAAFGGKFWAQVVSLASLSSSLHFDSGSGSGSFFSGSLSIMESTLVVQNNSSINDHLALLKCSLELLANQISDIMCRLNGVKLMLLVPIIQVVLPVIPISTLASPNTDMVLDVSQPSLSLFSSVLKEKVVNLGLSSSKVFTSKVGSFKSKIMAFEISIGSILGKLNLLCINSGSLKDIVHWHKNSENMILIVFTSGLNVGFCGIEVAIIINNFLAWHVLKVDKVSGHLIFMCLLFKNKLSIMILAADINFMISKAVNSSSFVVLGGDFNENRSSKSASFKFCLGLGLVNTFDEHLLAKTSIWSNSRSVEKVIDFILVSENLASAMALYFVDDMFGFFNTNYRSVSISIGLDGLLDTHLINVFKKARVNSNLNTMWKMLKKVIVQAANTVFSKIWYSEYDCLRNKQSFKFFKLELLITKIVKCWNCGNFLNFNCLIKVWLTIDVVEASKINNMILNGISLMELIKHLSVMRKKYHKSKYCESKIVEDAAIRKAIDCHMKNFCSDKEKMIKSILEHLFCKMVLDHLVVDDKLVIEPNKMKLKIDKIMKGWTKKQSVLLKISDLWS
ncbi:hypothetical protein G9A89_001765 [Geosiphon pyriformis]|nr:hypothetical protein G9A89_001765 [Geosiphon pyriformis]